MKRYFVAFSVYSAIHVLIYLASLWLGWGWHRYFPVLILFFFLQSLILGWVLSLGQFDQQRFPIYALSSVSLRLVTGILLLIVFLVMDVPDLHALTLQFVAVYLSFMIFELIMVLSNLRRNSGRNS